MAIVLKTKNKINNLDALHQKDAHAIAKLSGFNIVDGSYNYEISKEIILNEGDPDLEVITAHVEKRSNGFLDPANMQALWEATGMEIPAGADINAAFRQLLILAFINQLSIDGWYGLTPADWEFVAE